jgi:CRP/FNR family transcriptional regulator, cyclic AMP receptor protein
MGVGSFFDYPDQQDAPEVRTEEDVFLPDLDEAGWDRLITHTQSRRFARGETVIPAGSRDRSLLIVADGSLETAGAGGPAVLQTGAVLGELAFFDGKPHDAPVRALTDVDVLVLSQESFEVLAAREPALARAVLMDLGRIVSLRLRRALST